MQEIFDDYRLILKDELERRCAQNTNYSLRAFARDLSVSASRLSEILNKKQGLSQTAAIAMAQSLGFTGQEKQRFCDLVASQHARAKKDRAAAKERLATYDSDDSTLRIKNDAFKAIADWFHLAILELIPLSDFQSDPKWIARKLGISEIEVQLAVDRLIRLQLLKLEDGQLMLLQGDGLIPGDVPSDSIKKFHKQILSRAQEALYRQSLSRREFGTYILAVDKNKLAEAKTAIREFQHKFCRDMGEADEKNGIYCLSFQFFDLLEGGLG